MTLWDRISKVKPEMDGEDRREPGQKALRLSASWRRTIWQNSTAVFDLAGLSLAGGAAALLKLKDGAAELAKGKKEPSRGRRGWRGGLSN